MHTNTVFNIYLVSNDHDDDMFVQPCDSRLFISNSPLGRNFSFDAILSKHSQSHILDLTRCHLLVKYVGMDVGI